MFPNIDIHVDFVQYSKGGKQISDNIWRSQQDFYNFYRSRYFLPNINFICEFVKRVLRQHCIIAPYTQVETGNNFIIIGSIKNRNKYGSTHCSDRMCIWCFRVLKIGFQASGSPAHYVQFPQKGQCLTKSARS